MLLLFLFSLKKTIICEVDSIINYTLIVRNSAETTEIPISPMCIDQQDNISHRVDVELMEHYRYIYFIVAADDSISVASSPIEICKFVLSSYIRL